MSQSKEELSKKFKRENPLVDEYRFVAQDVCSQLGAYMRAYKKLAETAPKPELESVKAKLDEDLAYIRTEAWAIEYGFEDRL